MNIFSWLAKCNDSTSTYPKQTETFIDRSRKPCQYFLTFLTKWKMMGCRYKCIQCNVPLCFDTVIRNMLWCTIWMILVFIYHTQTIDWFKLNFWLLHSSLRRCLNSTWKYCDWSLCTIWSCNVFTFETMILLSLIWMNLSRHSSFLRQKNPGHH